MNWKRLIPLVLALLVLVGCTSAAQVEMMDLKCSRCGKDIKIPASEYKEDWNYICDECDQEIADALNG